jgi:hypothetical protein
MVLSHLAKNVIPNAHYVALGVAVKQPPRSLRHFHELFEK